MKVVAPAQVVELEVESIAAGGDGVGRSEGLVVFAPRTAPGDLARVRIESIKRFARGRLEWLLVASPDRVDPPCDHYTLDRCGGCQLQHLRYDAQLRAKQRIVRDALERIGRRTVEIPNTLPSEREWRYRKKLTLVMQRTGATWTMGLHPFDDPVAVFQLVDCPITDERVVATWREIMQASAHLPNGSELRGTVRLAGTDLVVQVKGGSAWPSAGTFFAAVSSASAFWWTPDDGPPRLMHERRHVAGGTSFGQINDAVAQSLRAHLLERVQAHRPNTIIDAYAGSGDTAVLLAALGARVTAIEVDREAAALCAARLPEGSRSLVGRVERMLIDVLPADVVIVNPPRAGLDERVTRTLDSQARRPRAIMYVSCDPATLARDIARLPSYQIAGIRTFDMFPQTAHVETVCELVPVAA